MKKGGYTLTSIILSGLFVSLVVVVFMGMMASGSKEYNVEYNNETLEVFNRFEEISATTAKIQNQTEQAGASSGAFDVLGIFFNDAYQALKLGKESYGATDAMIQAGTEELPLGNNASIFRQVASAALIVILFIGVILAAIIKRDL